MTARSALLEAVPFAVETSLKKLGADLRTARLRRQLTIAEVAKKIGTSRYAVADAERGKPSSTVAIYAALLWAYGLVNRLGDIIDPAQDEVGLALSLHREPTRTRHRKLSNDF